MESNAGCIPARGMYCVVLFYFTIFLSFSTQNKCFVTDHYGYSTPTLSIGLLTVFQNPIYAFPLGSQTLRFCDPQITEVLGETVSRL
jgi:hypothetical protein